MDAIAPPREQSIFFATGKRPGAGLDAIDDLGLKPALLARYRDLARLRYDFPLVLVDGGTWAGTVRSLSSVIDEVLGEIAPRGLDGERVRRHVLRLEHGIRALTGAGTRGSLSELWTVAAREIATPDDPSGAEVLAHIAGKLQLDGALCDCDEATATRVCEHLWRAAQQRKAKAFRATAARLVVRLSDILRAAFLHSEAGQKPDHLRASVGGSYRDAFDFDALSRLVGRGVPKDELPPARRARIERTLEVLKAQRFFADPRPGDADDASGAYDFRFDDCAAAADAFRERLPALAELRKAIAVAELEASGRYVEATHDPYFEDFGPEALSPDDLALFPDYLVCIARERNDAPANAGLMDMLTSRLPVRVLVETSDLIDDAAVGAAHHAFGVRSNRLANTATGLGGVFVVQTPVSHVYALRERLEAAFAHRGATLVSVYAGAGVPSGALPPYLTAAAALESRAFPAFTYDPYAGDNQAARFSLADNPQPDADCPVDELQYADENQQAVTERLAFTIPDFVLCDRRYAKHFARVPRERWNGAMVPADEWLAANAKAQAERLPYLVAVDANDILHRLIVDARLMQIAARVRTFWHRLQEEGGIHNSHAEILLARERARWVEQHARETTEASAPASKDASATVAAVAPAAADAGAGAPAAAAPAHDPDEPWIETARCPSCNECQTINDRMFRYNENKQAYIADLSAGTFRQLVEAAEACQVAIIHPGKPRNPDEPGLAALVERARPFL